MRKGLEDKLQDQRDLSQEIVELMSSGITEYQARKTMDLFSDLQTALDIAAFYAKDPDKKTHFDSYEAYLQTVKNAMENRDASKSLYHLEVEEKTNSLQLSVLTRVNYRDSPTRSSHYYEHLASQDYQ